MGMLQKNHGKNMKLVRLLALPALAALAVIGMSQKSRAALVASDNAGNSPYVVGNSFGGQNGGSGFGAWSVTNTSSGGNFISSANWSSITPWFDIYNTSANPNGSQTTASRSLNNALSNGETLSFDLVLNSAQTNASVGFYLADSSNNALFTYYQEGNSSTDGYAVDTNGTTAGIGVSYNYQSVDRIAFTLTSATTYDFSVNNVLAHSGTISDSTGGIAQLNFFDNGGGASSDVQFTDLSIASAVPLPASFGLVLIGGLGLVAMALSRRRSSVRA